MFPTTTTTAAMALLAPLILAAPAKRYPSQPFELKVTSTAPGTTYHNASVAACHTGAGIEQLCAASGDSTFTFNGTREFVGGQETGSLVYTLVTTEPPPIVQELQWLQNASSNVHAGFFGLASEVPVVTLAFENGSEQMSVVSDGKLEKGILVCEVTYEGHVFPTVSWVPDGEEYDTTVCELVTATRYFV